MRGVRKSSQQYEDQKMQHTKEKERLFRQNENIHTHLTESPENDNGDNKERQYSQGG
jgi:hypothetical protein